MARKPMPSIEVDGKEHTCSHAAIWPPMEVVAYEASPEELRYVFPGVVYRRLKTWEQVCGLMEMEADKCSQCPHVIVDGKAVREPGTGKARMIRTPRNIREIQLKEKRGKK